jgi:hypothetical protein
MRKEILPGPRIGYSWIEGVSFAAPQERIEGGLVGRQRFAFAALCWRRWSVGLPGMGCVAGLVAGVLVLPSSASALTDFSWSGATPISPSAFFWSNGSNWAGGTAPSGSVGTLSFPALIASACTARPPTDACYESLNDLSGLSVNAISIVDGAPYGIGGNGITLGPGGITATPTGGSADVIAFIGAPITLGAAQTWSVTAGSSFGDWGFGVNSVTGTSEPLTINLLGSSPGVPSYVDFHEAEVGPLSVRGLGFVGLTAGRLNATDGNPVSLSGGAQLLAGPPGASSTGPVTATTGLITVGGSAQNGQDATLSVNGGVALDPTSTLRLYIVHAGTAPGTDYSQLSATGNVKLASATLDIQTGHACPTLNLGDVYTLVRTTGSLTGTFSGVPEGSLIAPLCPNRNGTGTLRINYHESGSPQTVTATVARPGSGLPPNRPGSGLPPNVTNATQSHPIWREGNKLAMFARTRPPVGTRFSLKLNEPAYVTFAFMQRVPGRKVNGRCVAQTNSNHNDPTCKRTVLRGILSFAGHTGKNEASFQGRVSRKKKLLPGRYTLVITATNAARQRSKPRSLTFTIVS